MIARVFKLVVDETVMTFDTEGDPIRRFCGPIDILHDEILAAAPADAQFFAVDQKSKRTRIARREF